MKDGINAMNVSKSRIPKTKVAIFKYYWESGDEVS
jgi:hypothetical protein